MTVVCYIFPRRSRAGAYFQLNPIRSSIMVFLGFSVVLLRTDNKIGHLLCKEIYYVRYTCFMYVCVARLEWVSYGKVESKAV